MHFVCSKKELSDAVSIVSRAVSSKSSLPALEGILIKANTTGISLFAYDLELGMYTDVSANVSEPGDIILNAKIFYDMVRRLPADKVDIKADEKLMVTIVSGASEFTLLGIPASEFPELPSLTDGSQLHLPENMLSSMIKQTLFAVSSDESKPIHTGSLFEVTPDYIRMVSVDGFRLAIRTEKIIGLPDSKFVVPGKTLSELYKMLSGEDDNEVTVSIGKKHVLFEIKGYSLISRLLDGEFLDYNNVLGNQSISEVQVNVRDFADSVDRASLLISDRLKSPIRCIFEDSRIRVRCTTSIGRVYDEIPAKLTGESFEMGFNNRYLMDALKAAECDEVRIVLNGPLSPMKIYPLQGDSFIFLVLPVRLKTDE